MEQAAELVPERPAGVPEGAVWMPDLDRWELATVGVAGKEGEFTLWRADGSVSMRGRYKGGVTSGPFALYHPSGELARRGQYVGGELDGDVVAFASDEPTTEPLRSCCVPAGAWELRARWERGQMLGETFHDREGRPLLSDGTPRPERPHAVPHGAEYDEWSRRWSLADRRDPDGPEQWRYWTDTGRLDEEALFREGTKVHTRLYDDAGGIRQELALAADGVRHGPYRCRYLVPADSPWADARVVEECGTFAHGQPVGAWTFLDAAGNVLRRLERGGTLADGEVSEALVDEQCTALQWHARAERLRAEGRTREALCAAARAAATSGDAQTLRLFIEATTMPLTGEASDRAIAGLGDGDDGLAPALGALVGGADPASCMRTMASLVKGANRVAHDFAQAAILLAPDRPMTYLTRALVRIELGDPDGARGDAERVAVESPDTARFVRDYVRVLFPLFDFWPSREIPHSDLPDMPEAPAQPLDAIRQVAQVYVSRLGLVRAALVRRADMAPWLPPDLGGLLPEGPVVLRVLETEIVDEGEDGPEVTPVKIDETLPADLDSWSVPALMRLTRAQWSGLAWLCWCAGQNEVGLPEALSPPPDFAQAAGMAIGRYWRAQDGVLTGGLRSITAGVAGFTWEQMEIDGLPKLFAEMAADEYLEMRSVFLWLSSPDNLSPWQSDLRGA